jgi:YHS domain-containing protein
MRIIFYIVLLLFIFRALRSLWGGILEGLNQPRRSGGGVPSRGVAMVRDPVCGTFVLPERALSLSVGRELVYFCSARCRDDYRKRPAASSGRVEGRTA